MTKLIDWFVPEQKRLLSFAKKKLKGNHHLAEEAVQESFRRIFECYGEEVDYLPGRMQICLKNVCMDKWRDEANAGMTQVSGYLTEGEHPLPTTSLEEGAVEVKAFLDKMEEGPTKNLLYNHYVLGMSRKDSAELLGIDVDHGNYLIKRFREEIKYEREKGGCI